jgi:RNA polymerase sigma-70 factor (ECF subfamily)
LVIALNEEKLGDNLNAEIETLYQENRRAICAYLVYLGVSSDQADELTQEAFLRLYQGMRQGNQIENARAWLFRVAHNLGTKMRSEDRYFRSVGTDWERQLAACESPEKAVINRERNQLVSSALEGLSPQQRNCLYLRARGLRYKDIAEVMGISSSTVNEFLRRAIARLSEAVNE